MHARTLKALKEEQAFLGKATWGVLSSPPGDSTPSDPQI